MNLFSECSDRLCVRLESACASQEVLDMEALFSRMALDVIGKAVFNYEFGSLEQDTGIVKVRGARV